MKTCQKKKVLIIGPKDTIGGHGTYVNDVLRYQFRDCVVSNFNTTNTGKQVTKKGTTETADIFKTPLKIVLSAVCAVFIRCVRFLCALFKLCPDIVLITGASNLFYEQAYYIICCRLTCRKVFLHYHGPLDLFISQSGCFKRSLIGYVYGKLHKLIVLSRKDFDIAKRCLPHKKIAIITNYVSSSNYQLQFPQKLSSTDGITRLVFLGGSKPLRKGLKDIVKAINSMVFPENKVLFLLSGGDEVRRIIESDINFESKRMINILGWITEEDKQKLYLGADVMVLPSYDEGLPYALIEAMASGMAIVSTNIGGIPELVPSQDYGFIIEPGDIPALSAGLATLIRDKELCKKIGRNNIERVKQHYTMDKIFKNLEEILLS